MPGPPEGRVPAGQPCRLDLATGVPLRGAEDAVICVELSGEIDPQAIDRPGQRLDRDRPVGFTGAPDRAAAGERAQAQVAVGRHPGKVAGSGAPRSPFVIIDIGAVAEESGCV